MIHRFLTVFFSGARRLHPAGICRLLAASLALVLALILAPRPARAAVDLWANPAGGIFNLGTNWNSTPANTVPGSGDTAQFNIVNTYNVTFNNNPTNASMSTGGSTVTFLTDGTARTYTVTGATIVSTSNLTLGSSGAAPSLATGSLSVSSGRTLTINAGNDVSTGVFNLATSAAGTGVTVVDGTGSTFTATGVTQLGLNGGVGNLTLQNSASGVFTDINTVNSGVATSGANILVQSTASLQTSGNLNLGIGTLAGQASTFTVTGAGSTVTQTGTTTITIGASANSTSSLSVAASGTFNTGTGLTTINPTGILSINGTYNANGDILVNGGTLQRLSAVGFNLNAARSLTAQNNAQVSFTGSYDILSTFTIQSGADLSATSFMDIGNGGPGNLTVDAASSTLTVAGVSFWGANAGTANVTFKNAAVGTVNASLTLAQGTTAGTSGTLSVQSGATLNIQTLGIATGGVATGTITVTDASSTILQTGGATLTLGSATTGSATLNVNSGGTFFSGGIVSINSTGLIGIAGGTFNAAGNVTINSTGGTGLQGAITLTGPASTFNQNGVTTLTVGNAAASGTGSITVNAGGTFTTGTGATTVNPTGLINIHDGTYNAKGDITLTGGTLQRSAAGTFNLATGKSVTAQNNAQVSFTGNYGIANGSTFTLLTGSDLSGSAALDIGNGSNGTLIVDGFGSIFTAGNSTLGANGSGGTLTLRNGATGLISGPLDLAPTSAALTGGTLNVQTGATLAVGNMTLDLNGGALAAATVTLTDFVSAITQSGASSLTVGNSFNGSATFNVNNSATFTAGSGTLTVNANGQIAVNAGTFLAPGNINITPISGAGSQGKITVSNAGFITQTGPTLLTIGNQGTSTGTLTITSTGSFSSGTGGITINATGSIVINSGIFNANADILVNGGTLQRLGSSGFNLALGKNLTAQAGGQVAFTGNYAITGGSTFTIQSGADLSTTSFLDIGQATNGTLIVDGPGSTLTTTSGPFWGYAGGSATITIRNGAAAAVNSPLLIASDNTASTDVLTVQTGATMTVFNALNLETAGGASTSATVTVTDSGSSLTQNQAGQAMSIGNITGSATLNVNNNGTFTSSDGTTFVFSSGSININGGIYNANGNITLVNGTLTRSATGTFNLAAGKSVSAQGLALIDFTGNYTLSAATFILQGGTMNVSGNLTLLNTPGTAMSLQGASLSVFSLNTSGNPSLFTWSAGTLTISGFLDVSSAGPLTASLTIPTAGALNNNGTITLAAASVSGPGAFNNNANAILSGSGAITAPFTNAGTIVATGGILTLPAFNNTGLIQIADPTANLASPGTIANNATIEGHGKISAPITNNATIEATGGTLNLAGALTNTATGIITAAPGNKVLVSGAFSTNAGLIDLTGGTFDNGGQPLNNTGSITGYGTLRTGGTGLTNNGSITFTGGTSTINGPVTNNAGKTINLKYQPAIFTGNITNNGTIKVTSTTVTFTGTYTGTNYISDPATNIFQNSATITPGGLMTGGPGDVFTFAGGTVTNNGTFQNGGNLNSSVNFTNNGTFTQSGPQAWYPATTFTNAGGTANFQSDAGSPASAPLSILVNAGTVNISATQHLNSLTLTGGQATLQSASAIVSNLTFTTSAINQLNLRNNALILEATSANKSNLLQQIAGDVTGSIITSSTAVTNPIWGVVVADNADLGLTTFGGLTIDANSIIITQALLGDANLDGVVNPTDLLIWAHNFNNTGSYSVTSGDLNNDGIVNPTDLLIWAHNFNNSAASGIPSDFSTGSLNTDGNLLDNPASPAGPTAPVPEPATLVLTAALPWLLRRRRAGVHR